LPTGKAIVFTQDLSFYHLLGEQDENGIVHLNIDFLICIKSCFMAEFGQNYDKISFPRNSSVTTGQNGMQFSGMIEDMM
jgi:hypothetical protein